MDSSVPTILWSRVHTQVSILRFSIYSQILYHICHWNVKRIRINQKRPDLGHIKNVRVKSCANLIKGGHQLFPADDEMKVMHLAYFRWKTKSTNFDERVRKARIKDWTAAQCDPMARLFVLLLAICSNANLPNTKILPLGRGGGQVVSVLAFYSDDPSSNPAEVYSVTRWQDYLFYFWSFAAMRICPIQKYYLWPWWWSSGQRARLLFRRSEFESHWSLQFCLYNLCLKRTKINKKRPGSANFSKNIRTGAHSAKELTDWADNHHFRHLLKCSFSLGKRSSRSFWTTKRFTYLVTANPSLCCQRNEWGKRWGN